MKRGGGIFVGDWKGGAENETAAGQAGDGNAGCGHGIGIGIGIGFGFGCDIGIDFWLWSLHWN